MVYRSFAAKAYPVVPGSPHLAPPALALGIDHRSSELLRQQPGGLVCDTELDSASSNTPYLVYLGEHLLSGFLPPLHRDGTAQRIHHTAELYEQPSPVVFTSRPSCSATLRSISSARIALSCWRVPPSSALMSRL